jgi:hypothetical protein
MGRSNRDIGTRNRMASRADFCPFLFLPFTKPLITWKRGGLNFFLGQPNPRLRRPSKTGFFFLNHRIRCGLQALAGRPHRRTTSCV